MSELGEVLKKARLEKKMSLDEIQEQTKIRKRYLEALEEGDYDVLPGKFYVRAFIKNYAEAIGLDADEVLKYYHDDIPNLERKVEEVIPARKPQRIRSSSSEKLSKVLVNLLLWGFFILIIVVVWYYVVSNNKDEPNKVDETPITQNSEAPVVEETDDTEPEVIVEEETPIVEVDPTTVTYVETLGKDEIFVISPPAESYTLNVAASGGDSWVEVYDGKKNGTSLYYATMKDGESKSFTITGGAFIVAGRPGYVKITVDDAPADIGDSIKNSKRIILKSEEQ